MASIIPSRSPDAQIVQFEKTSTKENPRFTLVSESDFKYVDKKTALKQLEQIKAVYGSTVDSKTSDALYKTALLLNEKIGADRGKFISFSKHKDSEKSRSLMQQISDKASSFNPYKATSAAAPSATASAEAFVPMVHERPTPLTVAQQQRQDELEDMYSRTLMHRDAPSVDLKTIFHLPTEETNIDRLKFSLRGFTEKPEIVQNKEVTKGTYLDSLPGDLKGIVKGMTQTDSQRDQITLSKFIREIEAYRPQGSEAHIDEMIKGWQGIKKDWLAGKDAASMPPILDQNINDSSVLTLINFNAYKDPDVYNALSNKLSDILRAPKDTQALDALLGVVMPTADHVAALLSAPKTDDFVLHVMIDKLMDVNRNILDIFQNYHFKNF